MITTGMNEVTEQTAKPALKLKKPSDSPILVEDKKNKKLATEKNPTIEAIVAGLFKFEKKEQALARLEAVKSYFIISSKLPKDDDENTVKLWIRGYEITDEELAQGYLGNYAAIKVVETDGKFSLTAEKQRIALKYHPQRKRPKSKHPDWGHPALRIVKKGVSFDNLEDPQKILNQLHEEYPDISIPNPGKLYIIIYSKALGMKPPIQKFILEIKTSRDGGYFIEYKVNAYDKKADNKAKTEKPKAAEEENKTKGKFTAMVELRNAKKKKKAAPKKPTSSQ